MELPLFCQIIGLGIVGMVMLGLALRWVVRWQHQINDPLRYLRGKSREEIHQMLHTPVYRPSQKRSSKRQAKQPHRKP
jgi:hypothetical protein